MTFEFDGEKYQKASTHQKEWGAKLLSEFTFNGSEHILDLGCGDGAITAELATHVPNGYVVGIGASRGMIETALKNHKANNLEFDLIDINSINYNNKFDIIISNAALHWVIDHRKLFRKIYSGLKNQGIVRCNFAADGNCSYFFKIIKQAMQLPLYSKYFGDFVWPWYLPDIHEYNELIQQFAFSEIKVWGENADRNFPDAEAMVKWIDQPSLVPFLTCVDEKDRKAFRDFVVQQMIAVTSQPDGTCFETFRRVNLFARKQVTS